MGMVGTEAGEDTMVGGDIMVDIEVGTMVVFVEDTGVEDFIRITGDFGDFH
jgi:hypothetical protein